MVFNILDDCDARAQINTMAMLFEKIASHAVVRCDDKA